MTFDTVVPFRNQSGERFDGIATFVAVMEAGSFARAAQRLGQSRSAVGKRIARLEQRIGIRLFHRTTRRQAPTDDGQAYYEHCLRALSALDQAEAAIERGRNEPRGTLRISVPVVLGRLCIAPVLHRLAIRHPQLSVEMAFSDRVVELGEGAFDLAVRVGELPDSAELVARPLGVQQMGVCASPAFLAGRQRPRVARDLDGEPGILYGRGPRVRQWQLRDADGGTHAPQLDARLRFDDLQAIADAAIGGAGYAWLPCWMMARYLRSGELALVFDAQQVLPTPVHVVWPRNHYLPSRTRVAIDALLEEVPPMLGKTMQKAIANAGPSD